MELKKIICCLLLLTLQILPIKAESYCVMSGEDQQVLEEKDMHKQQSVASISKIMTAMIAIEKGNLQDRWQCSEAIETVDGSMIYLQKDQMVSLESLLYGLMLRSGNDAAVEIAEHVGGNEENFVAMMNEKAKEIGMSRTLFRNPTGLDEKDGGNVSTAYDMALLMSYALKNRTFRKIAGTKYYTSEWNYRWKNKNRLLFSYDKSTAGKTGFTKQAGRTLVTSAENKQLESIVVTLDMHDDFRFHEQAHQRVSEEYEALVWLDKGSYRVQEKQFAVERKLYVAHKKGTGANLRVHSHIEQGEMVYELQHHEQILLYRFPLAASKKTTGERL